MTSVDGLIINENGEEIDLNKIQYKFQSIDKIISSFNFEIQKLHSGNKQNCKSIKGMLNYVYNNDPTLI